MWRRLDRASRCSRPRVRRACARRRRRRCPSAASPTRAVHALSRRTRRTIRERSSPTCCCARRSSSSRRRGCSSPPASTCAPNTHDQVEDSWRVDISDRGMLRPRCRSAGSPATLTRGPFTVDVGKQFIRWGKTDIVTPTDRFAPRDFLNVIDTEFLAVTGARGGRAGRRRTRSKRLGAASSRRAAFRC